MNQPTASTFAQVARRLHGEDGVDATLEGILDLAQEMLEADHCGVMLVHRGGRVETAAASDDIVLQADALQKQFGSGPCLEAMADEAVFVITDTATETRWEAWCRSVQGLGIRSVLSVRLFTQQGALGALNIYSGEVGRYDAEHARLGAVFGGHASVALATARTESGLREAMEGRHSIGLAQGILMARFDMDQDQAFSVLRRYSQDRNVKLREVAAYVVEHRALPD